MIEYLKSKYTHLKNRGFTLIELIVVMAIIAMLVLLAAPRFLGQTNQAKDTNIINDIKVAEMKVGESLIKGTDEWDSWGDDVTADALKTLAKEDKLLGRGGMMVPFTVEDETYKKIPATFVEREIRSRLEGTYYANDKGTVYFETKEAHPYEVGERTIMGAKWNKGSNSAMTRTHAAEGLVANIGIGSAKVRNDFDDMPIYKDMVRVEDDAGNVFVKIPKFYISKTSVGGEYSVRISQTQHDETFYLPAVFYDFESNQELDYFLYGAYEGYVSSNKLVSSSGRNINQRYNITQYRDYAKANNTGGKLGYQQNDIHALDVLQALFRVEFATMNSQTVHPGLTSGSFANTGTTNDVVASSGAMNASAAHAFNYRGIENPWGNTWEFVDGVTMSSYYAHVARDASKYATNVTNGVYTRLGYRNLTNSSTWVREMGYDKDNPFAEFPTVSGGNQSSYYGDIYHASSGTRVMVHGGYYSNGVGSGLSHWHTQHNSGSNNNYLNGRLMKKAIN